MSGMGRESEAGMNGEIKGRITLHGSGVPLRWGVYLAARAGHGFAFFSSLKGEAYSREPLPAVYVDDIPCA